MAKAKSSEKQAPRAGRARLSKPQRSLLDRARRNAGLIAPAPRGNELRTAKSLLARGLLVETRTQPFALEYRRDQSGQAWALGISTAGREAIGWNEPLLPDRSTVIAGRLIKVFVEAHGREPASVEEFEAFVSAHVRAGWRSKR
jgi:hypothetical protein